MKLLLFSCHLPIHPVQLLTLIRAQFLVHYQFYIFINQMRLFGYCTYFLMEEKQSIQLSKSQRISVRSIPHLSICNLSFSLMPI